MPQAFRSGHNGLNSKTCIFLLRTQNLDTLSCHAWNVDVITLTEISQREVLIESEWILMMGSLR